MNSGFSLLALFLFSALSLNLLLSFGLGIRELVSRERTPSFHLYYPWIILFLATFVLWLAFTVLPVSAVRVIPRYVLFFPLSSLAALGVEKVLFRIFPKQGPNPGVFKIGSSYNGMAFAALFLTMKFALTAGEAALLAFTFSGGGLLAFLIIKEIQKRSFLETLPYGLRGTPLLLIALGLLSLIFSAGTVFFLKILLE